MTRFRLTPAAQRDLSEIWDYTEENWGADQATTYIHGIRSAVELVAEDAERGRRCDEILPEFRKFLVGSHIIFYTSTDDVVDVVRILHQRMDPTLHL